MSVFVDNLFGGMFFQKKKTSTNIDNSRLVITVYFRCNEAGLGLPNTDLPVDFNAEIEGRNARLIRIRGDTRKLISLNCDIEKGISR
jgi:hypothetical protein